jgi:Family of unknown function (DUF6510)
MINIASISLILLIQAAASSVHGNHVFDHHVVVRQAAAIKVEDTACLCRSTATICICLVAIPHPRPRLTSSTRYALAGGVASRQPCPRISVAHCSPLGRSQKLDSAPARAFALSFRSELKLISLAFHPVPSRSTIVPSRRFQSSIARAAHCFGRIPPQASGPSVCGTCGDVRPATELVVYRQAPGTVVRCRTCSSVLMVFVTAHNRTRVDLHGLAVLG